MICQTCNWFDSGTYIQAVGATKIPNNLVIDTSFWHILCFEICEKKSVYIDHAGAGGRAGAAPYNICNIFKEYPLIHVPFSNIVTLKFVP